MSNEQESTIRYDIQAARPAWMSRMRWVGIVSGSLWIVLLSVGHRSPVAFVFPVVCLIALMATARHARTMQIVVDQRGIKAPFGRGVTWSQVASVHQPDRWAGAVTLRLTNGRSWRTGLPADYAGQVAAIGNVPLDDAAPDAGQESAG